MSANSITISAQLFRQPDAATTSSSEDEDNITTTEDETTQDSSYELPVEQPLGMPSIEEESDEEESEEELENGVEDGHENSESESEIQFHRSEFLEQLGTPPMGSLSAGTHLYLLTGKSLTKFVRLSKYYTYGNPINQDLPTKMAIDIARTQQVVAPLTAVNTQDGELFVIDDVYNLLALRNLSDSVLERLTVMLVVYEFRALTDPATKALFTRLNTRQQFTIDTKSVSDIDQFMSIILAHPAFKEGIKSSAANRKANFPHISSTELRKSIQEIITNIRTNGTNPDISALANRLIDFNCICKGKPISTLFGLHISNGSTTKGDAIDDKTRERYKKMVAKEFYLASPYGRCWPQFLLGRADTELVGMPKGSSAPVIPVVSQKFSFTLKKN